MTIYFSDYRDYFVEKISWLKPEKLSDYGWLALAIGCTYFGGSVAAGPAFSAYVIHRIEATPFELTLFKRERDPTCPPEVIADAGPTVFVPDAKEVEIGRGLTSTPHFTAADPPDQPVFRSLLKEEQSIPEDVEDPTFFHAVSLPNRENTCFAAALVQAFLLDHEEGLRLQEQNLLAPEKREAIEMLIQFIDSYREGANTGQSADILVVIEALKKMGAIPAEGALAQQDADEMIGHLHDLIYKNIPGRMEQEGYVFVGGVAETEYVLYQDQDAIFLRSEFYSGRWSIPLKVIPTEQGYRHNPDIDCPTLFQRAFHYASEGNIVRPVVKEDGTVVERELPIAHRRDRLTTAPNQLVLPFNRFVYSAEHGATRCVRGRIEGINEILEVPGDYFADGVPATYRLDGIIMHQGQENAKEGHYWALVRKYDPTTRDSRFLVTNDSVVGPMKLSEGKTEREMVLDYAANAYILVFKKIADGFLANW